MAVPFSLLFDSPDASPVKRQDGRIEPAACHYTFPDRHTQEQIAQNRKKTGVSTPNARKKLGLPNEPPVPNLPRIPRLY
jgi:hypothetical protein